MKHKTQFEREKQLGQRCVACIQANKKYWIAHNVPSEIRKKMHPWYITEIDGSDALYVLCLPDVDNPKVHYKLVAQSATHGNRTEISVSN